MTWARPRDRRRQIETLVRDGDWACSRGDHAGLRAVCCQLADLLEATVARRVARIAELALADPWSAVEEWNELALPGVTRAA